VALLSTIHRGRICDTGKIDRKTKEVVKKPEAVIEYSANMGGVDRLDQKIKPYKCLRKGVRWYRKLVFHLMDITVVNADIVYEKNGGEKCSVLQFRQSHSRAFREVCNGKEIAEGRKTLKNRPTCSPY